MLINNNRVTVLKEKAAATVNDALAAITCAVIRVVEPIRVISIFFGVCEVNMTFGQPVRVIHTNTR
jgi:hypothetical protein